jgi:hypothetical protein
LFPADKEAYRENIAVLRLDAATGGGKIAAA